MTLADLRAEAQVPYKTGWHAYDAYAMTAEEGDFLYALVRMMQPGLVVESGAGTGISGQFIAEALRDNGAGRLVSYESDPRCSRLAADRLATLPATVILGDCQEHATEPDLVHIDSHPGRRKSDIEFWLTRGHKGLVVVHDADRDYEEFEHGEGVVIPGPDGFWVGRGR